MKDWRPPSISSYGHDVDHVIDLIFTIVGVWFLIALGILVAFVIAFRDRRRGVALAASGSAAPPPSLKSFALAPDRIAFVLIPAALVLAFDIGIDAASTRVWERIKQDLPPADEVVRIKAEQFVWTFTHPGADGLIDTADDIALENHLHVRVGDVVHFRLEAKDVIHSFFVPSLRLKQDAVPGRVITGWFDTTTAGTYQIACAELCGIGHTNMRGWLHVHEEGDYRAWIAENSAPAGS